MDKKHFYSISVRIATPPDHVMAIMSDIEHWHTWTPSVKKIKRLDNGPFKVGSKAVIYQPKLPPALWRVTALEPRRSFTWVSSAPGITVTAHHYIEPIPEGSLVTLSIKYDGFLAPILSLLTAKLNDRYLGFEATGLKKQCEKTFVS